MSIILSKKSQEFIKKNKISNLFIDINFIEEKCVQIYEPKIKIIERTDLNEYNNFESISSEKLTIFLSEKFIQIYGQLTEYYLDFAGFLKKELIIENAEPIIKNLCKIGK